MYLSTHGPWALEWNREKITKKATKATKATKAQKQKVWTRQVKVTPNCRE